MFWTIIGIILLAWLLGLIFEIAGGLIHILLVIALIVFIARMIQAPRRCLHVLLIDKLQLLSEK